MRLIDADALLNRMRKDPLFDLVERHGVSGVIEAEPTVDAVSVRHGKWIDEGRYADYYPHHAWLCSECGEQVIEIETPWYKYCPNCGAKMDGERKE